MDTMETNERTLKTRAGHKMFISTSTRGAHPAAIMIHKDWAQRVRSVQHGHRWTSVAITARQGPTQTNVDIPLISLHLPPEVNRTTDEVDIVMSDIVENKGKRTIAM